LAGAPSEFRRDVKTRRLEVGLVMDDTARIAARIQKELPKVKRGTLRFWGNWFGRPYDNVHTLLTCAADQNVLRMSFSEGESLSVWAPGELKLDDSTFQISDAERVLWEWFASGRAKTKENLFFRDFIKTGETVVVSTNVNSYTPDMSTDPTKPAVEILGLTVKLSPSS